MRSRFRRIASRPRPTLKPEKFFDRAVEAEQFGSLFEAARWFISCVNEQPWRFVMATQARPEQFARLIALLAEKNQVWVRNVRFIGCTARRTDWDCTTPRRQRLALRSEPAPKSL